MTLWKTFSIIYVFLISFTRFVDFSVQYMVFIDKFIPQYLFFSCKSFFMQIWTVVQIFYCKYTQIISGFHMLTSNCSMVVRSCWFYYTSVLKWIFKIMLLVNKDHLTSFSTWVLYFCLSPSYLTRNPNTLSKSVVEWAFLSFSWH